MAFTGEGYWGKPRDYTHQEEVVRKGQNWIHKVSQDLGVWFLGKKEKPIINERLKEVVKAKKKTAKKVAAKKASTKKVVGKKASTKKAKKVKK